jgi:hypothetical protein
MIKANTPLPKASSKVGKGTKKTSKSQSATSKLSRLENLGDDASLCMVWRWKPRPPVADAKCLDPNIQNQRMTFLSPSSSSSFFGVTRSSSRSCENLAASSGVNSNTGLPRINSSKDLEEETTLNIHSIIFRFPRHADVIAAMIIASNTVIVRARPPSRTCTVRCRCRSKASRTFREPFGRPEGFPDSPFLN